VRPQGVNGSQHDADGNPVIHARSFPDMGGWVASVHAFTAGWYLNGCACGEPDELVVNYVGDVRTATALGFDSVKFDGCGKQNNHSRYARLFVSAGRSVPVIENCHAGDCTDDDDSGCGAPNWCPFSMFRASRDINSTDMRWFLNLQGVRRFLDRDAPVSQPGCWAYGDILEVGRLSTFELSRAHFGAWAVTSSPLVLGVDLRHTAAVKGVWPIVSNSEAIAINRQWAGHPGFLVRQWDSLAPPPPPPPLFAELLDAAFGSGQQCNSTDPSQAGWSFQRGGGVGGSGGAVLFGSRGSAAPRLCLDSAWSRGHLTLAAYTGSPSQRFSCVVSAGQPCLLQQPGPDGISASRCKTGAPTTWH
jgi:hypothetical protein